MFPIIVVIGTILFYLGLIYLEDIIAYFSNKKLDEKRAERLIIYEKMLDYYKNTRKYTAWRPQGFCRALQVLYNSSIYLSELYELMQLRPGKGWNDTGYWFDPADTETRIKLLEHVIEICKE